jgi:hypothetical protein
MRNLRLAAGVAASLSICVCGLVLASNMSFKVVPSIPTADPDVYDISLPLVNNYTDLASVFNDINASAGCEAAQVTVFNSDQTSCSWTGPFSCNTALQPGEGVRVSTVSAGCSGWVIVGAHNPAFVYGFSIVDPGIYHMSIPYHTTALTLGDIFNSIPGAVEVCKFNPDQTSCCFTGLVSCDDTVEYWKAYRISVTAPTTWVPPHY